MIPIKFEKINENKIKCILTKQDLENKDIRISELAYGSKKARELFREMMEKAQTEINFDAENCPLMIEAVPMIDDTLVIFITKVDNPDELDTRFSKFTKTNRAVEGRFDNDSDENGYTGVSEKFDEDDFDDDEIVEENDEEKSTDDKPIEREITAEINIPKNSNIDTQQILDAIGNIAGELAASLGDGLKNTVKNLKEEQKADDKDKNKKEESNKEDKSKSEQQDIYIFKDLKSIISAAKFVSGIFEGRSSFFKNPNDGRLYLYINGEDMSDKDYARVGIILGEYGSRCRITYSSYEFFMEHFKCLRYDDAIEVLSQI